MLGTISAFAFRHRETKRNLCRGGRSQDLPNTDFYPAVRHLKYKIKQCTHSTTNTHKITTHTRQLQQYTRSTNNNYTKVNLKLATKHTRQIRILKHVQKVKTPKQWFERRSTRSHVVEICLWERLWACRKAGCVLSERVTKAWVFCSGAD